MLAETSLPIRSEKPLSADIIKYIAAAAMLIDHIAWCFVDTYTAAGMIMHTIGRITAPIMCYFIAEGYHYTKNVKKYLLRLGIFAAISWIPFNYMECGVLPFGAGWLRLMQSVIFTFFLGLLALAAIHKETIPKAVRAIIVILLCIISVIGDWPVLGVVWIILFDRYRGNFKKQAAAFAVSSVVLITLLCIAIMGMPLAEVLFQYGVLLALVPLYFYNGGKGRGGGFNKWFFYVFYPLHMLLLGLIKYVILDMQPLI